MRDEPFDDAAFASWLAGDPRRSAVFDAMWRRIMGSDMDAALNGYTHRAVSRRAWAAGSAALLVILTGGYQALPLVELSLAPTQRYAVTDKQVREIALPDGTRLTLAGGAEIAIRYTRGGRRVELSHGTIFANVAHDTGRPFQVDTRHARIVVVGTDFEVSSKPEHVRVTVASGVVRFGDDGWFSKPISLTAMQAATLGRHGLQRIADVAPDEVASWRSEWAEYKGAPLRRVIADLQTLSPLPIQIAGGELADKPMSGRIRLTDPVEQLQNLSIIYDFEVHHTDEALIISQK
jgi:transmembrane sensor